MRSSPWSLGLLMMVMGTALLFFAGQQGQKPPPTTYVAAVPLVAAGALLFLRRPFTYWVALGAGLVTIAMAVASFVVRRELVPTPIITVVIGLMVTLRVLLARSFEKRALEREAMRRAAGEGESVS